MRVRHHVHADRLSQEWLRRRLAWQIVSDLIERGEDVENEGPLDPAALAALLGAETAGGALDALLAERPTPAAVTAQMQAVRLLLRLLLATPDRPAAG